MGCGPSSRKPEEPLRAPTNEAGLKWRYNWPKGAGDHGPLNEKLIRQRIRKYPAQGGEKVLALPCGLTLRVAALTQRGYYPQQPYKANQDAFAVEPAVVDDGHWFAVYDGHGPCGEKVSEYAARHVVKNFAAAMGAGKSENDALVGAHLDANKAVAGDATIDDSQSGSTAVSVFLDAKTGDVYVANVGDSRAMLGSKPKASAKIQASALSTDQTPYRADERERVKKYGARVMTADQLDGLKPLHEDWNCDLGEEIDNDGDPPRLWAPEGDYPGTAFTRSIGDRLAEEIGVVAEPEITKHTLSADDRVLLIATDGIFEFITTRDCVDMASLYLNDSPEHVCNALTAEAYKHWITNEERTDDITVICIFIEGKKGGASADDVALEVGDVKAHVAEGDANAAKPEPSKKTRRGSLKKKTEDV